MFSCNIVFYFNEISFIFWRKMKDIETQFINNLDKVECIYLVFHLDMKKNLLLLSYLLILSFFITNCSKQWTTTIKSGELSQSHFNGKVKIEIYKDLIFVPITIQGKKYRFLFDTGAPLSISQEIQKELRFKIVSKGNIRDSDNNRKEIKWARLGSVEIGGISFLNQTAFIGDFKANPIYECLKIDGIIGSNMMRHCNWIIDQKEKELTFYDKEQEQACENCFSIPFITNQQYNIYIGFQIGNVKLDKVLVDYGSNDSVQLSDAIFSNLREREIINEPMIENGMKQSGIVGKAIDIKRRMVYSDSVQMNLKPLKQVLLRTGKTVSIGNKLLSRFRVNIDWKNQKLRLLPLNDSLDSPSLKGFRLGYSSEMGIHVQSVIENSKAYHAGVRPDMKVTKLDNLDFEGENNFCDYVNHHFDHYINLHLTDLDGERKECHFEQTVIE